MNQDGLFNSYKFCNKDEFKFTCQYTLNDVVYDLEDKQDYDSDVVGKEICYNMKFTIELYRKDNDLNTTFVGINFEEIENLPETMMIKDFYELHEQI